MEEMGGGEVVGTWISIVFKNLIIFFKGRNPCNCPTSPLLHGLGSELSVLLFHIPVG